MTLANGVGTEWRSGPPPTIEKTVLEISPKMQQNQYLRWVGGGGGVGRSLPHVGFIAEIFLAQKTHKKGVTPLFREPRGRGREKFPW